MKTSCLRILTCLTTLLLLTPFAYGAEIQNIISTPDPSMNTDLTMCLTPTQSPGKTEGALVNFMLNLVEDEAEYNLGESTALVLECSPFAQQQTDSRISQPTSNVSVSLRFSF